MRAFKLSATAFLGINFFVYFAGIGIFATTPMKSLFNSYKIYFLNKEFLISVVLSLILLVGSLVVNFYAGSYATLRESNPVNDLILDNIPVFDVDIAFIYGFGAFLLFVLGLCLLKPQKIPFVLKAVAVFVLVRSVFVTLTHIGPFPSRLVINYSSDLLKKFTFGGDLFFSGHTGLPFLMALVFWKNKYLRVLFTATAVFFGAVVLMAHIHYSIDVLAAFFITYAIYHLAAVIFKEDKKNFKDGLGI